MSDASTGLESEVARRFAALAQDPAGERRFPVGPDSAKRLGYAALEIDALPREASESFAGVGNPFSVGDPQPGATVLDLGSGAGLDSLLAARRVGPSGRVVGIDFTPAMVEKATRNARAAGIANAVFRVARADALGLEAGTVDVAISNGVLNLCVAKPAVLAELARVMRPGARLHLADILLEPHVTPEELAGMGEWSD